MPFVRFSHMVKHGGEFYDANQKIKVEEEELAALKERGAEEIDGRSGRPSRKSSFGGDSSGEGELL